MEKSSFFNSMNGDRRYKAEEFAQYFSSFIGNGVFPEPTTGLQVIAGTNMAVRIKAGKAWINGYMYQNTDELNKTIDNADGVLNRIDRVVVRLNIGQRNILIAIKKGTPGSNPVPPVLQRDEEIWELAIADVRIRKGVISITNADITDKRHDISVCGIVASVLKELDTTGLFAQYDALFNNFLQTLQNSLSGDVAGNLLNKLNNKQNKMVMSDSDFINALTENKTETDNAYLFMSRGDSAGNIQGINTTLYQALKNCETYTGYTIKHKAKPNASETSINSSQFQNAAFYIATVSKTNKKNITITPIGGNAEEIEEIREQVQRCFQLASEMKERIANALTGKGIPTSTTATTEKIVNNINEVFSVKTINTWDNNSKIYSIISEGSIKNKKRIYPVLSCGSYRSYLHKDDLGELCSINITSTDILCIDLGVFDISDFTHIIIPETGQSYGYGNNFISCSPIFEKQSFSNQEFDDAKAVRTEYDSNGYNTYYYKKRHGIDAIFVSDSGGLRVMKIPPMQKAKGHWFLILGKTLHGTSLQGVITFFKYKEGTK